MNILKIGSRIKIKHWNKTAVVTAVFKNYISCICGNIRLDISKNSFNLIEEKKGK